MGKPKVSAAPAAGTSSYRDDPDAVSLHTTRDDYIYDDAPALPSYSDSVAADDAPREVHVPVDEFATISQPKPVSQSWNQKHTPTPVQGIGAETSIRMDKSLMDGDKLYEYITNYLRVVPPRPCIRIQGWHWQVTKRNNKEEQEKVIDFDIVYGLQRLLASGCDGDWWVPRVAENTTKAYRGSWRKVRAPGFTRDIEIGDDTHTPPELADVCRDFADSKASLRAFRVSRTVTGLDTAYLETQITQLIRSTHYLGHVDVTFPLSDRHVDVYSPHWANRLRLSWARWIFYLTFLWIFTWPILFFLTRWWAVYEVEWRFSVPDTRRGGEARRFVVMSEADWLKVRVGMIPSLVLNKFQGDATDMPTNVTASDQTGRTAFRMPSTGNRNVDTAVGFIQGGVSAWNALNGRSPSNASGWGADERC